MNFSKLALWSFDIQIIGLFWAIAFGWFSWQVYRRVKDEKADEDFFVHHFWRWTVVGLILGRLVVLILHPYIWESYGIFAPFAVWEEKINIYAFLFGFLVFMWWDNKKSNHSFWTYLDLGSLPFLRTAMFMDVAFFLTGSVYGSETGLPWGIRYETFGVELITPVHPVPLYALILHYLFYRVMVRRENGYQKHEGRFFLVVMMGFLLIDVILHSLRADSTMYLGIFRIDQVLALLMLLLMVFLYRRKWRTFPNPLA